MAQAKHQSITKFPTTTDKALATRVAHELFELEERFLRLRGLTYAVRMLASAMPEEAGEALNAIADSMIEEVEFLTEERTRLCQLAGGSNAE